MDADALRGLGADGLSDVLRLRPDVLGPVAPRSLGELAARLGHPASVGRALCMLNVPSLQVAEAAAALAMLHGDVAPAALTALLGPAEAAEVSAAVAVLQRLLLLDDSGNPCPGLLAFYPTPLRFAFPVARAVAQFPVAQLQVALTAWGAPTGGRKADLVDRLQALLSDADRVRSEVGRAPAAVAAALVGAAAGEGTLDVGYSGYGSHRAPLQWALDRVLVVRVSWEGDGRLPAEVALALRGAGWRAPFEPVAPAVAWTPVESARIEGDAGAAAGAALRLVDDLLRLAGANPLAVLKDSSLGVRELRRVAKAVRGTVPQVRLAVALTHAVGLFGWGDGGMVPTRLADHWGALSPARRHAALVDAWSMLSGTEFDSPQAPWLPLVDGDVAPLRWTCLAALHAQPGQAPPSPAGLANWVAWRMPLAGAPLGAEPRTAAVAATGKALALLEEAAWLGVTGSGALSLLGEALVDQGDLAAALEGSFGRVHDTARLQGDLTAVVLGQPSAALTWALDGLADREAGSTAMTWRFTPATIRAALDRGDSADEVIADLDRIAAGEVPQPLVYLVTDTARRHGRLRAGAAACYLRSDDLALVAEAAADSKLRRLGLHVVAPGVLVGTRPLAETLTAMRAAGYAPVEEAGDGSVVLVRPAGHRTGPELDYRELSDDVDGGGDEVADALKTPPDLGDVAHGLLSLPDRGGILLEFGGTIIDAESVRDVMRSFDH